MSFGLRQPDMVSCVLGNSGSSVWSLLDMDYSLLACFGLTGPTLSGRVFSGFALGCLNSLLPPLGRFLDYLTDSGSFSSVVFAGLPFIYLPTCHCLIQMVFVYVFVGG